MLERMDEFFNSRLEQYEEHQMTAIEFAWDFYPFTAWQLPREPGAKILDLGCGTGLELDEYFRLNRKACVTGIDVSDRMIKKLRYKHRDKNLEVIHGSFFDTQFLSDEYDAAVSVEALHHYSEEEKLPLYRKLRDSLKPGGYFILTDFFAEGDETERVLREEYLKLRAEQGLSDRMIYHFDTPMTSAHEISILKKAGFKEAKVIAVWKRTKTIRAER